MLDAVPPPANVVIVESAIDHTPQIFMGFTASGSDQELAQLQKEARKLGLPAEPCPVDEGVGMMIAFPPGNNGSTAMQFYRRALAGKFGNLKLELALMPVASGRSIENDGYAVDPDGIVMPKIDEKP